nr:MAG TPA: Putative head tail adaptor [Caudoviricetes sp.]
MAISTVSVSIGQLNTPIEIQRFEKQIDDYGFDKSVWKTIARPRCKVDFDDRLIRQILREDGVDTTSVKLFTMRYIANITTKDRIYYKGKEFEIYSIQNINENNRFMRLWGREIEPTS